MRIIVLGKTGLLSSELQKLDSDIIALSSSEFDINDIDIIQKLTDINPDIIIHAAALTDSTKVNTQANKFIQTNIIGTAYISQYCITHNKRLVYISTDYIYPGTTGSYKEDDAIKPVNEYAWTKLGGECSVHLVKNNLIIRTSFGSTIFPYSVAWTNQITSKDYVDIIAPMILESAKSNITGILNIGTQSKTVYEYAAERNLINPVEKQYSANFSLNTDRYEKLFRN